MYTPLKARRDSCRLRDFPTPRERDVETFQNEPMKHRSLKSPCIAHTAVLTFLALHAVAAHAQNFAIDWYTIDGGGGTSSGGDLVLSGTIGQADAGVTMTNGSFALTGGFWSVFAVQTPNAPLLTIIRSAANGAHVSWPSPSTGFVLQQNSDLNSTNWVNVPQAVSDNGATKSIMVSPTTGRRFYRLFKP